MTAVPAWRLECHQSLGSTSDTATLRAEAGEPAGLAVQALRQTAGRGTRGRAWVDPGGNLALSVLLRPDSQDVPKLAFVAGLALHSALRSSVPVGALSLKWPNDVLLNGAKLAGILIEAGGLASAPWVVVGMGANLAHAPSVPGRVLAALSDAGTLVSPQEAAARVLEAFAHWLNVLSTQGFAAIREAWLDVAHPIGAKLAAQRGDVYIDGLFHGLDADGALRIQTDSGETLRIVAGDVRLAG